MTDRPGSSGGLKKMKRAASGARKVLKEPILQVLLKHSTLTEAQLETLLIDLVIEDAYGEHITYGEKAALRSIQGQSTRGVSRGAFNRTLHQARRNTTRCLYTMLLLAYLGLFDQAVFRPFEELATKIGDYRHIRDVLAGKMDLTSEDFESYRAVERTILMAIEELSSSLMLKSELAKKK
jgi:hypothetical protein